MPGRGHAQSRGPCGRLSERSGVRPVPDQPQGRRSGTEPDGSGVRVPAGSVVEPGGGSAGRGPRAPHRPDAPGVRLPADCARHGGGKGARAAEDKARTGRRDFGRGQQSDSRSEARGPGTAAVVRVGQTIAFCRLSSFFRWQGATDHKRRWSVPLWQTGEGMRVVIDATPLLVRSAGVKNYLYHWILHMRRTAGAAVIDTFPRMDRVRALTHEASVAGPLRTWSGLGALALSNHFGVPVLDWLTRGADLAYLTRP